jgi:hypothetical protein
MSVRNCFYFITYISGQTHCHIFTVHLSYADKNLALTFACAVIEKQVLT